MKKAKELSKKEKMQEVKKKEDDWRNIKYWLSDLSSNGTNANQPKRIYNWLSKDEIIKRLQYTESRRKTDSKEWVEGNKLMIEDYIRIGIIISKKLGDKTLHKPLTREGDNVRFGYDKKYDKKGIKITWNIKEVKMTKEEWKEFSKWCNNKCDPPHSRHDEIYCFELSYRGGLAGAEHNYENCPMKYK